MSVASCSLFRHKIDPPLCPSVVPPTLAPLQKVEFVEPSDKDAIICLTSNGVFQLNKRDSQIATYIKQLEHAIRICQNKDSY